MESLTNVKNLMVNEIMSMASLEINKSTAVRATNAAETQRRPVFRRFHGMLQKALL